MNRSEFDKLGTPMKMLAENESEWVSVDTELPDKFNPVLVYVNPPLQMGEIHYGYINKGVFEVTSASGNHADFYYSLAAFARATAMITEQEVEKAAAYIRDNSKDYAKAKAERVYLHEFRKSQKALLINLYSAMAQEGGIKRTGQEHESYAYAHDDYIQVLEGLRAAVEEEERLRWMIVAAQTKIDIWRTEQANNRRIDSTHQ